MIGVGTEIHLVNRLTDETPDKTVVSLDPLYGYFDVDERALEHGVRLFAGLAEAVLGGRV